jgi:hypothetical protein
MGFIILSRKDDFISYFCSLPMCSVIADKRVEGILSLFRLKTTHKFLAESQLVF